MQYEAKLTILNGQYKVDAVFELKNSEVTDVHFDYVTFYPVDFRRRSDDIDTKLYSLIETALKDNFNINEAREVSNV